MKILCLATLIAASPGIIPGATPVAENKAAPAKVEKPPPPEPLQLPGYKLLWQDEFNAACLDPAKWGRCERGGADWQKSMSQGAELVELAQGRLRLKGIVNPDLKADPSPFLTAGLTSKGKFDFQYGKVLIRARFKSADGAWPALWMLGAKGGWPANGEIDLMEHLNFDKHVHQTVHSPYTLKPGAKPQASTGTTPIARDDWNTYGCEWNAETIVFTVNGRPTVTYKRDKALGAEQWPFDQRFYFILSMQIGGNWVNAGGKTPSNPKHYPAWMDVDWIRVYQKAQ